MSVKRPRSWEDFSKQSKMFISERIVVKNNPDKMQKIYDKTLNLLFEGAKIAYNLSAASDRENDSKPSQIGDTNFFTEEENSSNLKSEPFEEDNKEESPVLEGSNSSDPRLKQVKLDKYYPATYKHACSDQSYSPTKTTSEDLKEQQNSCKKFE